MIKLCCICNNPFEDKTSKGSYFGTNTCSGKCFIKKLGKADKTMKIEGIPNSQKGGVRRSALERRAENVFRKLGLAFEYEPKFFKLTHTLHYLPDYYLKDYNVYLEVKGLWQGTSLRKCYKFKDYYPNNFFVIQSDDLRRMSK